MKALPIIFVLLLLSSCFSDPMRPAIIQQSYTDEMVTAAAISKDSQFSLIADSQKICLWNNKKNKLINACLQGSEIEHINLIGISANNQFFYTSNQMMVNLYNAQSGKLINQWPSGGNIINDIAISDNGNIILLGYRSGQANVILTKQNTTHLYKHHELDINSVSLSKDGQLAFSGSSDKTAVLWHTQTGEKIKTFKHRTRVNHVDLSNDGKTAFSLDAINDRFLWDLTTNSEQAELQTSLKFMEFNDSSFSADGKKLLTGLPNRKIQLWQAADGELITEWQAYKTAGKYRSSVLAVAFINSSQIASVTSNGMYEIFEF